VKSQHRNAFAALMTGIGELYGKSMTPELVSIYWDGLHDFEFEDVKAAVNLHVRNPDTGQFMPKIADVVKFIEGNTSTKAMRAWQKVLEAARTVGTYSTVVFDDALIHACITDMGGWQAIGLITDDELPFRAREFERRYQSYCVKGPARYPRKLVGIIDQQNAMLGYEAPSHAVLLGDVVQAQLVHDKGGQGGDSLHAIRLIERKDEAA
jgi:hypothetical protein